MLNGYLGNQLNRDQPDLPFKVDARNGQSEIKHTDELDAPVFEHHFGGRTAQLSLMDQK